MPQGFEALLIACVILAPGFIGFYVARESGPFPVPKLSDWELLLISISFAGVVLAVEVLIYAPLSLIDGVPTLAGTSANEFEDGYRGSVRGSPGRVLGIATGQFVLHCALVAVLGWFDPMGRVLEDRRRGRGFSAADPYTEGLVGLRQTKGFERTFVRAVLDSGECYYGLLSKMSNQSGEDGQRDLVLQVVSFGSDRDAVPVLMNQAFPENTVVALNTRTVRAIEGLFIDPVEH